MSRFAKGWCLMSAAFVIFLWPAAAEAHLMSSGMGPFYDGAEHLLSSLDDLLGIIALALLAGQNNKQHGRYILFALPASWIVGGFAGLMRSTEWQQPVVSSLSIVVVGAMLATRSQWTALTFAGTASLFGLLHGYLNGSSMGTTSRGWIGLMGIALTVFVSVAFLSSFSLLLKAAWTQIAVRVAGSWIVAIGLLMTGWALR